MDKVQKHNSFNTNTPSSESYRKNNLNMKGIYDYCMLLNFFSVSTDYIGNILNNLFH
jgi:hypothetical protein